MDSPIRNTAAVCIVRDAHDIVPLLCGHYLRLGFERLAFIDDSSSDGTYEFLYNLSKKMERIIVTREIAEFDQAGRVTRLVNDLIADGYRLVFPFDSDEFWNITSEDLRQLAQQSAPRLFVARWVNFVQSRNCCYPRPFGWLSVRHSAVAVPGAGREDIVGRKQPFVAIDGVKKVALWSNKPVELSCGQHECVGWTAPIDERQFEMFHLPFRYFSEIGKRALNYSPRIDPFRSSEDIHWQSLFHRHAVFEGFDEDVWRANSADANGRLDVYGVNVELRRDSRLRYILTRSALYMLWRYGVAAF